MFVLRDEKYYLAEFGACPTDFRVMISARIRPWRANNAEQREGTGPTVDSYNLQIESSGPSEAMKSCVMPRR